MCTTNTSIDRLNKLQKRKRPFKAYKVIRQLSEPNGFESLCFDFKWKLGENKPSGKKAEKATRDGQEFTEGCLHLAMNKNEAWYWYLGETGVIILTVWVNPKDVVAVETPSCQNPFIRAIAVTKCTVKSFKDTPLENIPESRKSPYQTAED